MAPALRMQDWYSAANLSIPSSYFGLKRLWEKLHRLKQYLGWWNRIIFGNIFYKLKEEEQKVVKAEETLQANYNPLNQALLREAVDHFQELLKMEETFWRQKAACKWNLEGDKNTKLFHNIVKRKRCKGRIVSTVDYEGRTITNPMEIHNYVISYFTQMLANDILISASPNLSSFVPFVDHEINTSLCEPPLLEEVKAVVFGLSKEASAGPDGYTAQSYQECWDIVKEDLVEAIKDFFSGSPLPVGISETSLALIPKVQSPRSWSEYRPISLCNFSHKEYKPPLSRWQVDIDQKCTGINGSLFIISVSTSP